MNPAETPPLQYDVIGIGAATLDTLHLVPDFPATEGVTQIIASTTDGGGPVATALCFLAKHGLSCALLDTFGDDDRLIRTLEKDNTKNSDEGVKEIYRRLRPGDPPTVENARSMLNSLLFDARRYDLAKVGRYKYNKKLSSS